MLLLFKVKNIIGSHNQLQLVAPAVIRLKKCDCCLEEGAIKEVFFKFLMDAKKYLIWFHIL